MKAPAARTVHTVDFGARSARRPTSAPTSRVPRIAQLLALAHKVDGMVRGGQLRDLAHAAEVLGLTRARMTQIANLILLAPEIQEAILDLPPVTNGRDPITERALRPLVAEHNWERQLELWRKIAP